MEAYCVVCEGGPPIPNSDVVVVRCPLHPLVEFGTGIDNDKAKFNKPTNVDEGVPAYVA